VGTLVFFVKHLITYLVIEWLTVSDTEVVVSGV